MSATPTPIGERRSAVESTAGLPEGTLVTVPVASPTGSSTVAPVVAVATVHWYKDPALLSAISGALLSLLPVAIDALQAQTFNWKATLVSALCALAAYFRKQQNTVVR